MCDATCVNPYMPSFVCVCIDFDVDIHKVAAGLVSN